jgi:hypothetical protein
LEFILDSGSAKKSILILKPFEKGFRHPAGKIIPFRLPDVYPSGAFLKIFPRQNRGLTKKY